MVGVFTFVLFLWHQFSVSNINAKFIDHEEIQKNANRCRRFNALSDKKIEELFDQKLVLSHLEEITDLCFIRCLYHISGLVDDRGHIPVDFIVPYLRELTQSSANVETEIEVEDKLIRLAKDIIVVCHRRSTVNTEKLCLASVTAVECLEAVLYLLNYGYLSSNDEDLLNFHFTSTEYQKAIINFQTFFSLPATGMLDLDSLKLMNTPRCGVMDMESLSARNKRYDLYRMKWDSQNLTYRISKYSKKIHKNSTDEEIARAFTAWANVSNLTIKESENSNNKTDINIRFEKRVHGDRVPFDGPGRILAHTFYPSHSFVDHNRLLSCIHFDNAEKWTIHSSKGVNLYQIAVHEIGHSLGLKHSNVKNSVMWPKHDGYVENYTLHSDDIDAIQALYGSAN